MQNGKVQVVILRNSLPNGRQPIQSVSEIDPKLASSRARLRLLTSN